MDIDTITDDEVVEYICNNEQYVRNIYAPIDYSKETNSLIVSDDYKRLLPSDKIIPDRYGISAEIAQQILDDCNREMYWTETCSGGYKWEVNMSEQVVYPRISDTMWFTSPDNDVYINNLIDIKKAIFVGKHSKHLLDDISKYHPTSKGVNKAKSRLFNGKYYKLETTNDLPLIGVYEPDSHIKTFNYHKLDIWYSYESMVRLGDMVLLEDRKTNEVTVYPIHTEEDLESLPVKWIK